jgi:hypothetical protein
MEYTATAYITGLSASTDGTCDHTEARNMRNAAAGVDEWLMHDGMWFLLAGYQSVY